MRKFAQRAVLGTLIALLPLAVAEGAARWLLAGRAGTERSTWYRVSPTLGWLPRAGYAGRVYGAERTFFDRGLFREDATQAGDADVPKVVLLGDSRTFGFRVPVAETFGEILDRKRRDLAVINLAVPGYSVVQGEVRLLEDGLDLAPAAVVVAFGFNDRRYVLSELETDGAAHFRSLARSERLRRTVDRSALARWLRERLFRDGTSAGAVDLRRLPVRVSVDEYRSALRRLLATCAARDIATFVVLLPDNPEQTGPLRRGRRLLRAGRARRAIAPLSQAVAADGAFADLARLQLAAAWSARGLPERARQAATTDGHRSLQGSSPLEFEEPYQAAARQAAGLTGAVIIDLTRELTATDFLDFCHLTSTAHRRVADRLATELAAVSGDAG